MRIIHYYSKLFTGVLTQVEARVRALFIRGVPEIVQAAADGDAPALSALVHARDTAVTGEEGELFLAQWVRGPGSVPLPQTNS